MSVDDTFDYTESETNPQLSAKLEALRAELDALKQENRILVKDINKYRSYIENVNDLIGTITLRGVITYVSPNIVDIAGHEVSDVINQNMFEKFMHPDDVKKTKELFHKGVSIRNKVAGIEYRILHKDGTWHWYTTNASPIYNDHGRVISFLAIQRDVTEKKLASDELLRSQLRMKEAQRIGKIGNWEWTPRKNRIFWSEEMYQIFGIKNKADLLTNKPLKFFYPDDRIIIIKSTKLAVKTRQPQALECRIVLPGGEIRHIYAKGEVHLDKNGKLEKVVGICQDITERKLAEELLSESTRKLNTMVNNLKGVVYRCVNDGNWTMEYISAGIEELSGYPAADFINNKSRLYSDIIHPNDVKSTWCEIMLAIAEHRFFTFEYRIIHQDGEIRWVWERGCAVYEGKRLIAFEGFISDVTDRKKAEDYYKASKEQYGLLLDTMREGVVYVDNDDKILYINQSCCDIYGYKQEDLIGKIGFKFLIHPEDGHIIEEKNKTRLDGIIDSYEVRGKKISGETVWLKISGAPIRDNNDIVIGSVGLMSDITEQKLATDALLIKDFALQSSLNAICLAEMDGKIIYINEAYIQMWGYKHIDEVLGMNVSEFTILKNPDEELMVSALMKEGNFVGEGTAVRTDGTRFVIQISANMVKYPCGHPICMMASFVDITQRKQLEEQLLASQKMEAIGQLAGGVAHDFNNLLTVILGYGEEMVNNLAIDDNLRRDAEEIVKAGKRASGLTHQLLTFSRKQVIQPKVLDLNVLVANLYNMLMRLIGEHIRIITFPYSEECLIKADSGQIEQVIINLVVNARDAMPSGGTLTIETSSVSAAQISQDFPEEVHTGQYIMLTVSDTGCGMDEEVLSRVYEPFYTTKKTGKGLGLGLSTVYGIVKQSHGYISMKSKIDDGTIVKILLPVTNEVREEKIESIIDNDLNGKGELIMIVEDEESLCLYIKKMVEKLNYRVTYTVKSRDALKAIEKGIKPDLIISDVVMPEMNGKELIDQVKRLIPNQKVLFMSGFTDDVIEHHGILDNDIPFIQKPFSPKQIAYLIKKLLAEDKPSASPNASVLMIDDEEDVRVLVQRNLQKSGVNFVGAANVEEALKALTENTFDVLIVDMNLGSINGIEALLQIRKTGVSTPALLFSGINPDLDAEFQKSLGVVAFVMKSFNNLQLMQRINEIVADKPNQH